MELTLDYLYWFANKHNVKTDLLDFVKTLIPSLIITPKNNNT